MAPSALPSQADFHERLELFFGEASDALCRVYARLQGVEAGRLRLEGTLRGPTCPYAHTLEATLPLVDRGPGSSLLSEVVVTEPCFWTPEMPHLYQADVRLLEGSHVVARAQRLLGLRTLGALGRKLMFDAKRWVLRGVSAEEVPTIELPAWHTSDTALVIECPRDALLAEASRLGVLVVALVASSDLLEIHRLSRWPAVGLIALPANAQLDPSLWRHNAIMAQCFAAGEPVRPQTWAQAALCDVQSASELALQAADAGGAIIARRAHGPLSSVAAGRALCDNLQRDLAGRLEIAGYIV